MGWEDALEIVVKNTLVERYRYLCSEEYPDRETWRREMVKMATGEAPPPAYPPVATMAGNLFRSARDWARSGFKLAPKAVRAERLAICESCPKWDSHQHRCTVCGCTSLKFWAASSRCPLPDPKWREVT
jgi:hypothetical protein